MSDSRPDPRTLSARASKVVLAVALVTAVSGYFMGLHQTTAAHADARRPAPVRAVPQVDRIDAPQVPLIVDYARLGDTPWKPNAGWQSHLALLRPVPRPEHSVTPASLPVPASDLERSRAVEIRASRRAFEGAPPVIPHPIDPLSPANCLACHQQGLAVREVVAPKMSHREMGSCTQCHVPVGGPGLLSTQDLPQFVEENTFVGARSAGRGSRVWPGAPPTIPHSVWMRQDCSSCHGPTGLEGLRTSHPERTQCQQCHVPDGVADVPPWLRPELATLLPP